MKVTKRQLRRIIKEEKRKLLREVRGPGGLDEPTQALAKIALSQLGDGGYYRGS